jgi:hypothetical protein
MEYPELPKIPWFIFASQVRIKWAYGVMPEGYAPDDVPPLDGTDGYYRKETREIMKDKKLMPKPATKKGKGKEKSGKEGCKHK